MPRGTFQDAANQAGGHGSTEALALCDHPRIPARTRGAIQATAKN